MTRPGPEEFKARWCLRGYLDPDVTELTGSGATQSPTVSQLGRMLSRQMIVSNGWDLLLGDIRGAFSGGRRFGSEERIAVLKSSFRRNPRGARWIGDTDFGKHLWSERCTSTPIGFTQSTFDVCIYSLRSSAGNLEGILCVHVDHNLWWTGSLVFRSSVKFAPSFSISLVVSWKKNVLRLQVCAEQSDKRDHMLPKWSKFPCVLRERR